MNKEHLPRWIASVAALVLAAGCQAPGPQDEQPSPSQTEARRAPEDVDPLHPQVKIETTVGDIVVELDAEEAPGTVLNFMQHVQDKYYDGTVFHRVIKNSMIQGGGYTSDMERKLLGLKPPVEGAWTSHLHNERHTVAMIRARATSGAGRAQFYINVVDNPRLDEEPHHGRYAVFGKVIDGLETVEKIRNVPVGPHAQYAEGRSAVVPVEPIVIKSIRLLTPFHPVRVQEAAVALKAREGNRVGALVAKIEKEAGSKAVVTKSGLQYVDFVIGSGMTPVVTDEIEFHYRGTLLDGTEFESTYATEPAVRRVGNLIAGLREGITTMSEGGRRALIIPPELGFAEAGIPGYVPPDATLVFEIDLLAIK